MERHQVHLHGGGLFGGDPLWHERKQQVQPCAAAGGELRLCRGGHRVDGFLPHLVGKKCVISRLFCPQKLRFLMGLRTCGG